MFIKNVPNYLKPREKALTNGINTLTDIELLAIILRVGSKNISVLDLSANLIDECNGLKNMANMKIDDLVKIDGLGKVKALEIMAVCELSKRINEVSIRENEYVNNPKVIYELFKKRFENCYQEHFMIVLLNTKNAIIGYETIFKGTLNHSIVHPREIFSYIIRNNANSFICVHNHPSGDPTPSQNDIEVTKLLKETSQLFGINFLDHIIIGNGEYVSLQSLSYM